MGNVNFLADFSSQQHGPMPGGKLYHGPVLPRIAPDISEDQAAKLQDIARKASRKSSIAVACHQPVIAHYAAIWLSRQTQLGVCYVHHLRTLVEQARAFPRLLAQLERVHPILFFDEAEALFGDDKRSAQMQHSVFKLVGGYPGISLFCLANHADETLPTSRFDYLL